MDSGVFNVAGSLSLGWDGKGSYTQNGGTAVIKSIRTGNFDWHGDIGQTGTVNLNGGELTVGDIIANTPATNKIVLNLKGGILNLEGTVSTKNNFVINNNNLTVRVRAGKSATIKDPWMQFTAGTLDVDGTLTVETRLGINKNLTIDAGTWNVNAFNIVDTNNSPNVTVTQTDGTVTVTGTVHTVTNQNSFKIGHYPGTGLYDMSGGSLAAGQVQIGWNGVGTLRVSGNAVADLGGISVVFNGGRGTFDLNGGRVNVGTLGIKIFSGATEVASHSNCSVLLGDGILGASADWSSISNMTLDGTKGVTFDTNGHTITLSGILSGSGGMNKTGDGTLVLKGNNTYPGATNVQEGTLLLEGSLASEITLTGGILTGSGSLGTLRAEGGRVLVPIQDGVAEYLTAANVDFSAGMFDLGNFEDVFSELLYEDMAIFSTPSDFGDFAENLDALFADSWGYYLIPTLRDGTLFVRLDRSAVPEPTTWGMLLLGALFLFRYKRTGKMG